MNMALPALIGSHPLGALASFGLLRWASEMDRSAKLAFVLEDDWVAHLHTANFADEGQLISQLCRWSESEALDRLLGWADDVRVSPETYRSTLEAALERGDMELCRMLGALVADGAVDNQKGLVKPSAFYMVSGQQSFLDGMREVLKGVRKSPELAFREALLGPWRYQTKAHSLGWDPNTERLYALRHRAPTSEKATCIAAAVLLGLWALPLMPALSIELRAVTIGFSRIRRGQVFRWPVFSRAIGADELASLLQVGADGWVRRDGLLRTGIEVVYQSTRSEFGQGYAVLKPAMPWLPSLSR